MAHYTRWRRHHSLLNKDCYRHGPLHPVSWCRFRFSARLLGRPGTPSRLSAKENKESFGLSQMGQNTSQSHGWTKPEEILFGEGRCQFQGFWNKLFGLHPVEPDVVIGQT